MIRSSETEHPSSGAAVTLSAHLPDGNQGPKLIKDVALCCLQLWFALEIFVALKSGAIT